MSRSPDATPDASSGSNADHTRRRADVPVRRARLAVTLTFVANGLAAASFITRIPDIRVALELREAVLGGLLSLLAVGVVSGLMVSGRVVPQVGSRRVTIVGATLLVVALPLVGLSGSAATLGASLALLGLGGSVMDVGMNAQGVAVERRAGRSIMLGLHGGWSVGTLLAALIGAAALAARVPVAVHLGVMAAVIALLVVVSLPALRAEDRVEAREPTGFAWPKGALLPLGLVALAGALGEATASDWSGIFLADVVEAPTARVGWGFVAYTAAMTASRLVGDVVVRRWGAERVLRGGGLLAGAGFVAVALAPTTEFALPIVLAGFVAVGLGLGGTVPLAFAAAGRVAASPGAGVAAVASVGYLAFIIGPSSVGLIAEYAGLAAGFVIVGLLIAGLIGRPQPDVREPDGGHGRPPLPGRSGPDPRR